MDQDPKETRPLAAVKAGRRLALRQAQLVVTEGPDAGRRFAFTPPRMTVGTLDDNDVVLTDTTVSKRHLVIEDSEEGCLLKDLGTTNGTYLDQHRIKEAFLTPNAVVKVGGTSMKFEPASQTVRVHDSARSKFGRFIGQSAGARALIGLLERVAPSDLSVLVLAETGAGKEVVAQSVHEASKRAAKPFVVFDCSAVARELVESALFGHKPGAFTGAAETRKGAFLSSDGGTLFLDEIGELPLDLQPKLLRALEQRRVTPLGSDTPVNVNVRLVAATNRDLREMVRQGTFRRDLFYRLAGVEVLIPPLRERPDDIAPIALHFMEQLEQDPARLTPAALAALAREAWPGNVRELKNVIERAVALSQNRAILPADLLLTPDPGGAPAVAGAGLRSLEDIEAEAVRATLERTNWNKSETARILGISRNTLAEKIQRYKIEK